MKKKLLFIITFLLLLSASSWAQSTISGKVIDEKDDTPIVGAVVFVKSDNSIASPTDADGKFTLNNIPEGAIIVVRAVGYNDQEFPANAVPSIIKVKAGVLEEVIVTAYKETSKKGLVGSVATVSSDKFEQVPIATFDQMLQGTAPGLLISSGSGQPGSGSVNVLIRGENSISSSTDPLYILDGTPIDAGVFATMNPNDFESISVLRDAAATALYGARGANGVIVITSKKGQKGKPVFNYRFQTGWALKPNTDFEVLNTNQKIDWEIFVNNGPVTTIINDPSLSNGEKDALIADLRTRDTDWRDELWRVGKFRTHEINASGGSDKLRYYTSLSYYDEEGIAFDSRLSRYTARININSEATENFRFGFNTFLGYSLQKSPSAGSGLTTQNPFLMVYLLNPYEQFFDPETGNYADPLAGQNIYANLDESEFDREEYKLITSLNLGYDVPSVDGLTINTRWGMDYRTRELRSLWEPNNFNNVGPNGDGELGITNNRRVILNGTTSLNYSRTIANDHQISIGLYNEVYYEQFRNSSFEAYGLTQILEPNGTTAGTDANGYIPVVGGGKRDQALLSYFGNLNYSFKNKYFLDASLRRDGSSRFGENNRFATFWAVGAGWLLTEEDFIDFDFLDLLKLRFSYGTSGNSFITVDGAEAYYPAEAIYFLGSGYAGGQGLVADASFPGNDDLRWEKKQGLNVGLDVGFLKNRFTLNVDYYNEKTSNLFINQQLSRTSGFSELAINAGVLRNQGIELSFNADIIRTVKGLVWSVGGNYTHNQNRVIDLAQVDEFELGTSIVKVGEPIGSHFLVPYVGVSSATGEPLYRDLNGNVTNNYDAGNAIATGLSNVPTAWGGFNTNLSYKGLSLSLFFTYATGQYLFNNNQFFFENPGFTIFNQHVNVLNTWRNPGDITNIPGINYDVQINSTRYIQDASYLRLRNITIAYNVPAKFIGNGKYIRSLRLYAQGQNLLTFTRDEFTGFDPEDSNNIIQGDFPDPRKVTLGIDLGF